MTLVVPRTWSTAIFCALLLGLMSPTVQSADEESGKAPPSLASVAWAGPVPNPAALKGKTVVVLTYVTWCPKCNAWAGNLFSEIKQVIADQPVVVLAVSTDTAPAKAVEFMKSKEFLGVNIFHGYDPTIAKRFGFTNEFYNFAIISPTGVVKQTGNAGSSFAGGAPAFVVARLLAESKDLGSFRFLKPEMAEELKQRLWPIELGASNAIGRDIKKLEKGLKKDDVALLRKAVNDFKELEASDLEELSQSDQAADKFMAVEKASFLSSQFAATSEGKRAKEILVKLQKDDDLKQELLAKRQYDIAMKVTNEDRRAKSLESVAKKYPDTYYGEQATRAAQAATR